MIIDDRLFTKWSSQVITNNLSSRTPTALLCVIIPSFGMTRWGAVRTSTVILGSECFPNT